MSDKQLRVIDSSATSENPKRIHTIIFNGEMQDIIFEYGKETILPEHLAMKFAKEGFKIVEVNGEGEINVPRETPIGQSIFLQEGEVIAIIDELTDIALKTRCIVVPGGEIFALEEKTRAEMITFLKTGGLDFEGDVSDFELGTLENEDGTTDTDPQNVGGNAPQEPSENPVPATPTEPPKEPEDAQNPANQGQGSVIPTAAEIEASKAAADAKDNGAA